MRPHHERISSVGLHVLYEPDKGKKALVDIVLVHGFGGHPMRSWQYESRPTPVKTKTDPLTRSGSFRDLFQRSTSSTRFQKSNTNASSLLRNNTWHPESNGVTSPFWPRDLLPAACPATRIITWGYHAVRRDNLLVQAQPDIFVHANELLRELGDFRYETGAQQRPLALIAHSIGGVIIKDMLRQSELSNKDIEKNIVNSTAAIVFFGCPHSVVEQVPLADIVLSMTEASSGIRAEHSVLSSIYGIHDRRWFNAQESFIRLWHHFNFAVKTYHETRASEAGCDQTKISNSLAESSKLGDMREHAESLPGDHRTLCQFRSADDIGFRSLSKFLNGIVKDEREKLTRPNTRGFQPSSHPPFTGNSTDTYKRISSATEFRDWYHRQGGSNEQVLWLTGSSGSGKSTQLRYIRHRLEKQCKRTANSIIFCNADGQSLDRFFASGSKPGNVRSMMAIRSILLQLFALDNSLRQKLISLFNGNISDSRLARFFLDDYIGSEIRTSARRTFILVDADDSCDTVYIQDLLHCLCQMAQNSNISLCLASRPVMGRIPVNIIQLSLENHSFKDIEQSVHSRLKANWDERSILVRKVAGKANGNFLWAELATNLLNKIIDGGGSQNLADQTLGELPVDLDALYECALGTLSSAEKADAATIMRWVMLAPEPLTLNDLRMAVRLTRTNFLRCWDPHAALDVGIPSSMQALQKTGKHFDTPSQFYYWLRSRTYGLLHTRPSVDDSTVQQSLGLQYVHPTHESVKSFFLSGRGFAALSSGRATAVPPNHDTIDLCHYSLVRTILAYLNTLDLSPLVSGQRLPELGMGLMSLEKSPTWRQTVADQRNLIMSSYPFLQYAVDNLLYHLLSPRSLRYFLPQQAVFHALASNDCRIWRRWTALLGESEPSAILAGSRTAETLLRPEFGAYFRLERVFRAVSRMATGESWFSSSRKIPLAVAHMPERAELGNNPETPLVISRPAPLSRMTKRGAKSRGTVVMIRRRESGKAAVVDTCTIRQM
ncbi:hypothetical protein F5Y19DRAFT_493331 [Xylariaceae sp. FL1651]|nr:hypothetical protein F5Y19DRAFT_493331 [Xylariaceae sp. FL1651]